MCSAVYRIICNCSDPDWPVAWEYGPAGESEEEYGVRDGLRSCEMVQEPSAEGKWRDKLHDVLDGDFRSLEMESACDKKYKLCTITLEKCSTTDSELEIYMERHGIVCDCSSVKQP